MKILTIFNSPGDEIAFGWPIFQNTNIRKHLICVTGTSEHQTSLETASKILNFTWECLNIPSGEVCKNTPKLMEATTEAMKSFNPQYVFTHNPYGEYNHPDHVAIFQAVNSISIDNLLVTDICLGENPPKNTHQYYISSLCSIDRQPEICSQVKKTYRDQNNWTWNGRDIDNTKLYFAKGTYLHRKYLIELLTSLLCPYGCSVAEIGVFKGGTSEYLSQCENINKLYSIDPWKNISGYSDHHKLLKSLARKDSHGESIRVKSWEKLYHYVNSKLSKYEHVHVLRLTSEEAALQVENDLDFVFLDGDHSHEAVTFDLNAWIPKVKSRGIIAGHDYTWNSDNKDKRPLVMAVLEYFKEHCDMFDPVLDKRRNHVINRLTDRVWWQRKM